MLQLELARGSLFQPRLRHSITNELLLITTFATHFRCAIQASYKFSIPRKLQYYFLNLYFLSQGRLLFCFLEIERVYRAHLEDGSLPHSYIGNNHRTANSRVNSVNGRHQIGYKKLFSRPHLFSVTKVQLGSTHGTSKFPCPH
jgi:hypothetical protein